MSDIVEVNYTEKPSIFLVRNSVTRKITIGANNQAGREQIQKRVTEKKPSLDDFTALEKSGDGSRFPSMEARISPAFMVSLITADMPLALQTASHNRVRSVQMIAFKDTDNQLYVAALNDKSNQYLDDVFNSSEPPKSSYMQRS